MKYRGEIWKPIPSLPGYVASSFGRVQCIPYYNPKNNRMYGGTKTFGNWDGGRMVIVLRRLKKTVKVHRLICEAFNGPPPFPNCVCMHLDENGKNNRPDNLQWGTQKENLAAPGFLAYCRSRTGDNSPYRKGKNRR